jgi:hypothetical protein
MNENVANAKLEATAARERLLTSLRTLQARLSPSTLATSAWDNVRDRGEQVANDVRRAAARRPMVSGAVVASLLAFIARRPLRRLIARVTRRTRNSHGDES